MEIISRNGKGKSRAFRLFNDMADATWWDSKQCVMRGKKKTGKCLLPCFAFVCIKDEAETVKLQWNGQRRVRLTTLQLTVPNGKENAGLRTSSLRFHFISHPPKRRCLYKQEDERKLRRKILLWFVFQLFSPSTLAPSEFSSSSAQKLWWKYLKIKKRHFVGMERSLMK